jgi:uncharacterized protein (TIGR04222 family)
MDPSRTALFAAIQSFPIDDGDPSLSFEARLARDHGWSRAYAHRVVAEYRRYLFLAATAGESVCPSEDVDAAWHLHLTYTRSYWARLCGGVIGRPLHHDPTRGGPAEADKHRRMYERTLRAYREVVGEEPPADVWPGPDVRFGADLSHRVVNTARNWVIPKAPARRAVGSLAAVCAALLVMGCAGGWNPFDLVGIDFLGVLLPVMVAAVVLGRVLRWHARKPGAQPGEARVLTWEEAAYLNGGYPQLATAAIARLVASGAVRVSDDSSKLVPGDTLPSSVALTASEAGVYACLPLANTPKALRSAQSAVETRYSAEADRLLDDGLLMSVDQQQKCVFVALVPLALVVVCLGLPRLVMGVLAHRPVGYLVLTLLVGGYFAAVLSAVGDLRVTRRGVYLLRQARARHRELRSGRAWRGHHDVGMAVGLFGTAALAGSSLAALAAWYPLPTTHSSGGCGAGCGGGGCGGGGCGGGCGGCGG